ncbi:MAG: restriction endonuclease subunit R [Coleofasciculus sp. S288]|nr:restriction endonuclease subunit R [Coleofasciculus sp. S288]
MTTLNANKLSLEEVEWLLNLEEREGSNFTSLLSLQPITASEQAEVEQIHQDFRPYLRGKKALEGQVRLVVVAPLLRLAGFYRPPIQIRVEEDIERIYIEDDDQVITGKFDIIAVNKNSTRSNNVDFWVLVIETKRSELDTISGLPQLLTYASQSLQHQEFVWGLVTNGIRYQFVYLQRGNPSTYQQMPLLNLLESDSAIRLLQVLKAICQLPGDRNLAV